MARGPVQSSSRSVICNQETPGKGVVLVTSMIAFLKVHASLPTHSHCRHPPCHPSMAFSDVLAYTWFGDSFVCRLIRPLECKLGEGRSQVCLSPPSWLPAHCPAWSRPRTGVSEQPVGLLRGSPFSCPDPPFLWLGSWEVGLRCLQVKIYLISSVDLPRKLTRNSSPQAPPDQHNQNRHLTKILTRLRSAGPAGGKSRFLKPWPARSDLVGVGGPGPNRLPGGGCPLLGCNQDPSSSSISPSSPHLPFVTRSHPLLSVAHNTDCTRQPIT